jgi:hypothetical protein
LSYERILAWSLAVSAVVHLIFLLLSPLVMQTENPPVGSATVATDAPLPFGLEMIVAIPSENAPDLPVPVEAVQPTTRPDLAPPRDRPAEPGAAPPAPSTPGVTPPTDAAPSRSNILRPGYRDPRLYVQPSPYTIDTRTDHERYEEHLQARIDAVNDSMGIATARNRTTADWTTTDSDGDRWGLSSEGLHLGGITIPRQVLPLPAPTGDNASRAAAAERERQRQEIQRQEADRQRRETQRERIEATREEEDRRRATGGGR